MPKQAFRRGFAAKLIRADDAVDPDTPSSFQARMPDNQRIPAAALVLVLPTPNLHAFQIFKASTKIYSR
jgi:hypothetical protein